MNGKATITAVSDTFERAYAFANTTPNGRAALNEIYPSLESLNSAAKTELLSPAPIEPSALFNEILGSLRFAVASASAGDNFTPGGGGNSGRGGHSLA